MIWCRDPVTIPDPKSPVTLVATGDSVTSAHHQKSFSRTMCKGDTTADHRQLIGNDANFSYAGRYGWQLNKNVVRYYNFARTGFGTSQMLSATPSTPDACGNAWNRDASPVSLAANAIRVAKQHNNKAYHVSTGGVNNTNWTKALQGVAKCTALEWAYGQLPKYAKKALDTEFTWDTWDRTGKSHGKAGSITYGGGCTLKLYNPLNYDEMVPFRIGLQAYDGNKHYPTITNHVAQTVKTVLAAGADKSVWMAYYDISPANVDVMTFIITAAREVIAGNKNYAWLNNHLPDKWKPIEWDLIDPLFHNTVRAHTKDLNAAIKKGLPADNPKVIWSPPTALTAAGIQNTMVGGSPHPNAAGHKRLAKALQNAYQ